MDTANFIETIGKSDLPFMYSGEKLNDEKCRKALKKIGGEGTVLGVIAGNALMGLEGLAVTEKGIWYALSSISTGDMGVPIKTKGVWLFNKIIIHKVVTVKKTPILPSFEVELLLWDTEKRKSFTIKFKLVEDNLEFKDSMVQELESIFTTLTSKTGTEYVVPDDTQKAEGQASQAFEKDPNTFDFEYGDFHTVVTLKDDAVGIKNFKIDDKTKIQTPKGNPVTIPLSAIASIQNGRSFSPSMFLKGIGAGLGLFISIGLLIWPVVGFILFLFFTLLGFFLAFPGTLIIIRKDGTKFTTRFYGNAKSDPEYERFVNTMFTANISTMALEDNQILKKMDSHKKLIGICFIAVLIITIIVATASPSTSKLEKAVWTSIEEQQNIQITDLKLVKLSKGNYSGIVTAKTIFGGSKTFNVTVVTDGRNIKWQLDN
ncbi:MAG: hypothetical protein LBH43_10740 [Treponema sp.]|jgi:hypothetical protein|nr:hypothetical protein [Treponema sp.]